MSARDKEKTKTDLAIDCTNIIINLFQLSAPLQRERRLFDKPEAFRRPPGYFERAARLIPTSTNRTLNPESRQVSHGRKLTVNGGEPSVIQSEKPGLWPTRRSTQRKKRVCVRGKKGRSPKAAGTLSAHLIKKRKSSFVSQLSPTRQHRHAAYNSMIDGTGCWDASWMTLSSRETSKTRLFAEKRFL